mmetsp:Transcript_101738/g.202027  ORF Transcript_101738/g.202027 Transcript_101738/m.202027 type:complete len:424 (-) Transcript_101738:126-1397(-)
MALIGNALLVLGMLTLGSYNTISSKLRYQTDCPALPTGWHTFNKPWFTNLMMFGGEAALLIPVLYRNMLKRSHRRLRSAKLKEELLMPPRTVPSYIFAVPACCDILGSGIAAVAMMLIDAAVWQMMRGAIIVFTAVFSVLFLRRSLHAYHWLGVAVTVAGLLLVGFAAVRDGHAQDQNSNDARLGVALVILAQVFSALQFTFEEHLLTGCAASSLETVGMEGVWGCLFMVPILLVLNTIQGHDHDVYESLPDGLHMLQGCSQLQVLVGTWMMSIALYNFVGMQLCRNLSAVTRCLVDCMRTGVIWAFQLGLHYFVSAKYGHPWTANSKLQLMGFVLLMLGTFVYNGIIKVPVFGLRRAQTQLPAHVLQATWSPTVNRAAVWGHGPQYGPESPHSEASPPWSPASPVGLPDEAVDFVIVEGDEK